MRKKQLLKKMMQVIKIKENIETIVPVEKVVESSERIDSHHDTVTKVYMNLSEPDQIERYAELPFEGIGLLRLEFMISSLRKETFSLNSQSALYFLFLFRVYSILKAYNDINNPKID